jgi:hypothetical protein
MAANVCFWPVEALLGDSHRFRGEDSGYALHQQLGSLNDVCFELVLVSNTRPTL